MYKYEQWFISKVIFIFPMYISIKHFNPYMQACSMLDEAQTSTWAIFNFLTVFLIWLFSIYKGISIIHPFDV